MQINTITLLKLLLVPKKNIFLLREKDPNYYINMQKRVKRRWARSHHSHKAAPKSANTRKSLRDSALEEWEELELAGFSIEKDTSLNPWGLKITAPK